MNPFALPPSLILAVFAYSGLTHALPNDAPPTSNNTSNDTGLLPSTGSGPSYATACASEYASYSAADASWSSKHRTISSTTELLGGTSVSVVTYYENATTLCDGHPRVTYSPAKSLSTGSVTHAGPVTATTTVVNTYFSAYPSPSPTCSIKPADCDPLWQDYSRSLSAGAVTNSPVPTPPCQNTSEASSISRADSQIYGCGKCTIYGNGVELVYFPTTASVDYCASTPTAALTHYGPGAVITAYAGKSKGNASLESALGDGKTVVADGHTFTSGTAYISISTVYAVDRCSKTYGTPIKDAILAMPSESVLSLRYSQNHFQQLMSTDRVTGYPVSYADFNTPVPWSAWNGQNLCDGPYGGWACGIIYENQFRPQLAIPPEITRLSPDFEDCQMFYNGLWDPPLALKPAASAAQPTYPGEVQGGAAAAATPSPAPGSPTAPATALPDVLPTSADNQIPGPTLPVSQPSSSDDDPAVQSNPSQADPAAHTDVNPYTPAAEPWQHAFTWNGHTYQASAAGGVAYIGGKAIPSGGASQAVGHGLHARYGQNGLVLSGSSTVDLGDDPTTHAGDPTNPADTVTDPTDSSPSQEDPPAGNSPNADGPTGSRTVSAGHDDQDTATITIGHTKATVVQNIEGGPIAINGTMTLKPGGPATTLPNGEILSAAAHSLVMYWSSTLGKSEITATASVNAENASTVASTRQGGSSHASSTGGSGSHRTGTGAASTATAEFAGKSTNEASKMSSSQAISLFAALIAAGFMLGG